MKVLLLNPPGRRLVIRDLYCSVTSKAHYYWEPVDLVVLSGLLSARCEVAVLDAMVERLSPREALRRVSAEAPDAVVSLTGSATWEEDFEFLRRVKEARPGCRVVLTGDVVIGHAERILERFPFVDACLTDFTSSSILEYLSSGPESPPLDHLYFRGPRGLSRPSARGEGPRSFVVGEPRHELFPLRRYRLPYARPGPVATVLASFACPFACGFCIQSARVMRYKTRPPEDVMRELRALRRLGVREVLFRDPTFEASRDGALGLCRLMEREGLGLTWSCNSRVDTLDAELVAAMAGAGCRMVLMGFESASDETLRQAGKNTTQESADRAVALCRGRGIGVSGYFILGLPGETLESAEATIARAIELDLDYAAFSAPSPDYGTPLRETALREGWAAEELESFDRSEGTSRRGALSPEQVRVLLRRAYRRFYFRPRWLLGQLKSRRGTAHWREAARYAAALARRVWAG